MPGKFDDLDLREEPDREDRARMVSLSGTTTGNTFHCTGTDACTNACGGTKYCN